MARRLGHRTAGALAVAAGVLALLTLPFVTAAYGVSGAGAGTDPPWGAALRDAAEPMFGFAGPDRVYSTYGLVYLAVVLGVLTGFVAVGDVLAGGRSRPERWGLRLLLAGLVLNLAGLLTDYTVFEDTLVENVGFAVGSLLGLLLLVVGGAMVGARWAREREAPRTAGVLLLLAVPGMVALDLLGFGNLPSMPLTYFGVAGIALGCYLLGRAAPTP